MDLSLLIEGQLLSQEQDLRAQGCARAEQETEETKSVHTVDQVRSAEKHFLPASLFFLSFRGHGRRTNKCQHLCQMGAG